MLRTEPPVNLEPDGIRFLRGAGLLRGEHPQFTPLAGGVSSDVWLVEDEGREFVVKRCVPRLRVQAEWYSDPARLRYENLYLHHVGKIVPGAVPRLLTADPASPLLAMEYLGPGFANWKTLLLERRIEAEHARRAGDILGRIHAATTGGEEIRAVFDTMEYFTQLRIDAYFRATAAKQSSEVGRRFLDEADRLLCHQECLVHGDYSPKNMLAGPHRFVILDCETACFGDPAFDLAFVLNHLLLKALYHCGRAPTAPARLREAAGALCSAYARSHPPASPAIASRAARLLPMLMLARVDGKSPVEYLDPERQNHIRALAPALITGGPEALEEVIESYFSRLPASFP